MSDRKIKLPVKEDDDEEMRVCYSCELSQTITEYRFRNKKLGIRLTQCRTCYDEIAQQRRYTYDDTKICPKCKEELPIDCFWLKSETTGQREARCGDCIQASRDPKQRKEIQRNWYYNKGGQEWVKVYNELYKPIRNKKHRERCVTDPAYKIKCLVRNRIYDALRRDGLHKDNKIEYLGISSYYYMMWIAYQFDKHMTWENHGTYWEIDHVKPLASFDFNNEDEIYDCFDFKNTRPLEKTENGEKRDKVDMNIMRQHRKIVVQFIMDMLCEHNVIVDNNRYSFYTCRLYEL